MASTTTPARGATVHAPAPASQGLPAIGVGIDTARYGHVVSFLRPDRQPAASQLLVMENHASYQALRERLEQLQFLRDIHRHGKRLVAVAQIHAAPARRVREGAVRPLAVGQDDQRERTVFCSRIHELV